MNILGTHSSKMSLIGIVLEPLPPKKKINVATFCFDSQASMHMI